MKWIFDVDGTLTPSRGKIDEEFREYFLWFVKTHQVYLATGSDYPKTIQQIGHEICEAVEASFNCSGNSIWVGGKEVYRTQWELEGLERDFFEKKLLESKFKPKTGLHIEDRPGMANFSVVGRKATFEERFLYKEWDEHKNERHQIAKEFADTFGTNIVAQVAGDTGIDIFPAGYDKSQIAERVTGAVVFFGDKMMHGGNDFPLAEKIIKRTGGRAIQVKDWKDTWKRMKEI